MDLLDESKSLQKEISNNNIKLINKEIILERLDSLSASQTENIISMNNLSENEIITTNEIALILSKKMNININSKDIFRMTKNEILSVNSVVITRGGTYLVFNKNSSLALSFRSTFKLAVNSGDDHFIWKKNQYKSVIK